jgi:hypothetical protein
MRHSARACIACQKDDMYRVYGEDLEMMSMRLCKFEQRNALRPQPSGDIGDQTKYKGKDRKSDDRCSLNSTLS